MTTTEIKARVYVYITNAQTKFNDLVGYLHTPPNRRVGENMFVCVCVCVYCICLPWLSESSIVDAVVSKERKI